MADQKAPISKAMTPRFRGGFYSFLCIAPLTLDLYHIMLSFSKVASSTNFESLVWQDLGRNPNIFICIHKCVPKISELTLNLPRRTWTMKEVLTFFFVAHHIYSRKFSVVQSSSFDLERNCVIVYLLSPNLIPEKNFLFKQKKSYMYKECCLVDISKHLLMHFSFNI